MEKNYETIMKFRYFFFPLIAIIWMYGSGKVAEWLNHGQALVDDPSAIYGYSFLVVPVINALFVTSLYSSFLNNSLTRDEYARASWGSQMADNLPEIIIFIVTLWFFHAHS